MVPAPSTFPPPQEDPAYRVFLDSLDYLSPEQIALIEKAYAFAAKAHEHQKRMSGEPYITHPLAVAGAIVEWRMDADAVMAALLHDVLEDTGTTKHELAELFGKGVAELVDGLSRVLAAVGAQMHPAADELGKVTHLIFRNAHHAAYARWFDNPDLAWFTQPELSGGGALLDMGTHAVHLLRHLGGPVTEVWCMTGNFSGAYPTVDDYGVIMMKFASGAIGRAEAGWVFTGGHSGLEVIGSKQSIWNADGLKMGGPGIPAAPVASDEARPDRIPRLIAVVKGELPVAELEEDVAAAYDAVKIMAAAYESSKTGRWTPCR